MTNLFQKFKRVKLSSGQTSDFKIDCDALVSYDIACLAYLISKNIKFSRVVGVPTGGDRLALALTKYITPSVDTLLICDDVLTTGKSMERARQEQENGEESSVRGIVIFARSKPNDWINCIFQMNIL